MPSMRSIHVKRDEPSRRERQRLETRNRLYEAAIQEFRQVGFSRAQVDRIVERAGVARGTFYFHFPTKEDVLAEMQRRLEAAIVERFTPSFRAWPESVREFLAEVVAALADEARAIGDPALIREIVAMYARERRTVNPSTEPLFVSLVDYFTEAAERGEVRSDLSPEEITGIFLTSLFGFVVVAVDRLEESLPEFMHLIDVFARGIAP